MLTVDYSPNKGVGIFARKRIPRGTVVTVYPSTPPTVLDDGVYILTLENGTRVTGSPWTGKIPEQHIHPSMQVGHLINDGAILKRRDTWPGIKVFNADATEYAQESLRSANVKKNGLEFITIRNIQKGEELLDSYGPCYWLGLWCNKYLNTFIINALNKAEESIKDGLLQPNPGYEIAIQHGLERMLIYPLSVCGFPVFDNSDKYYLAIDQIISLICNGMTEHDILEFETIVQLVVDTNNNTIIKFLS